ncbi:hypothetical protein Lal_00018396 [Lupinus albus]|nr:hypothetical protein Lal_00018396 [Lupinus albus]
MKDRWRLETHTFNLPCGECTITLEDVSLQIGMNINGLSVTGPAYFDWNEMCRELLGKVPIVEEDMRGCELKLTWLVDNFSQLPPNLHKYNYNSIVGHTYQEFTYIVGVKLVWQTCIGSLCRATKPNVKAWYRLSFLAPRFDGLLTYPFSKRWGQSQLIFQGVPHGDMRGYKSRFDHMEVSDFKWLPYETYINNLPRGVQRDKMVWNRVRLQFGLAQDIPQHPNNLDALYKVDKRGNQDANWSTKHAQWIEYWSEHRDQVLRGPQI